MPIDPLERRLIFLYLTIVCVHLLKIESRLDYQSSGDRKTQTNFKRKNTVQLTYNTGYAAKDKCLACDLDTIELTM